MTVTAPGSDKGVHPVRESLGLSPSDHASLWQIEERFWTSGADSARSTTAKDAVMIFPFPPGILQGDQIWPHLSGRTGWRSVSMTDRSAVRWGMLALLAYRVWAEKSEVPIYAALCASTYIHDEPDNWLRISHQQTPFDPNTLNLGAGSAGSPWG